MSEGEIYWYFKCQVVKTEFNSTSKSENVFIYDPSEFPAEVQYFYTIKKSKTMVVVELLSV